MLHHFTFFDNFNNALQSCSFPTALKYADIRPEFKKDDKADKENFRPISILPNLSKVYKRLMYDQTYPFLIKSFQNCDAVFVKVLEKCLIRMIEKWQKYLDTGGNGKALLTDLFKDFESTYH